jgi:Protein of unknown function (DUF2971)
MIGKNRIMIYGPKTDGTYIVQFRTDSGAALEMSVPRGETAVLNHFQSLLGRGLALPDAPRPLESWKRQFIRLLFHYSRKRTNPSAADRIKAPHVPSTLYKFRRFCDHHKKALEDGVLWRTPPSHFNDPYDSLVYFDIGRFLIEDFTIDELRAAVTKSNAEGKFRPKPLAKPTQHREWQERFLNRVLEGQPEQTVDAVRRMIKARNVRLQREAVQQFSDTVREGYSVISFAGDVSSVLIWSHYSQEHKGFCIEYNLSGTELGRLCYPVIYRRKLLDSSRYIFKRDPADFNNLFPIYASILKSDEWSYEREWRIVLPAGKPYATDQVSMPKPTGIILGALVEPTDEELDEKVV